LFAWLQPPLLDALQHRDLDLMMERNGAVPVHRSGQPGPDHGICGPHHEQKITKL
jgi:hypothetical protein